MIDEGYTKYQCDWRLAPAPPAALVAELNAWRNRLYAAGLVGYYAQHGVGYGNVSMREPGTGCFIVSGTQTGDVATTDENHYSRVTAWDVDANRVSCEGPVAASSEAMTHAILYTLDDRIAAVVHVHDDALWHELIDRLPTTDRDVSYGTPEMARELERLYRQTAFAADGVAVMGGHEAGLLAIGDSISAASQRILRWRETDSA
jgi:L-ribulose-5-phosphate 4-epimerase